MIEHRWTPILEDAISAWSGRTRPLAAIARGLEAAREPGADLALFWAYAAGVLGDSGEADRALVRFWAGFAASPPDSAVLDGGLAYAAWIAGHLGDGIDDVLAVVDRRLRALASAWPGSYDLLGGLAGIAVYALARDDDATLAAITDALAERSENGNAWRSLDGGLDLGLAHGVAGPIAILGKIAARGHATAARLAADAARYLLAQRTPAGFPSYPGGPTRLAWCYGEPGVSLALWHAGVAPDLAWTSRIDDTTVIDAGLCHGAAGVAHICNRFYQATGDPAHRDAARAWIERLLTYPHDGTALLTGAAGVGLVLAAALGSVEPVWITLKPCDVLP